VPALLIGVVFALVTSTRPGRWGDTAMKTLYRAFDVAAPPIVLFIAIGMLLAAVKLPGSVKALSPIVSAVSPSGPWLFVAVFAVLVPLCLYRGPLNIYGLGAGIAGVLITGGVYPAPAVLGLMSSYGQGARRVRSDEHADRLERAVRAGVRPEKVMLSTLPYTWVMAIGALTLTSALFLVKAIAGQASTSARTTKRPLAAEPRPGRSPGTTPSPTRVRSSPTRTAAAHRTRRAGPCLHPAPPGRIVGADGVLELEVAEVVAKHRTRPGGFFPRGARGAARPTARPPGRCPRRVGTICVTLRAAAPRDAWTPPTGKAAVQVRRTLRGTGLVAVLWDALHPWRHGEEPARTRAVLGDYLGYFQLKDAVGTYDPTPVAPGEGTVPLDECGELLRSWSGWISLEWEKAWYRRSPRSRLRCERPLRGSSAGRRLTGNRFNRGTTPTSASAHRSPSPTCRAGSRASPSPAGRRRTARSRRLRARRIGHAEHLAV